MKQNMFCMLIVVVTVTQLMAQKIEFEENYRTKSSWLRSVLDMQVVDTANNKDIQRLSNSGLFQSILRRYEGDKIVYTMTEKKYFVPIVYTGGLNGRPPKVIVGGSYYNLFGRAVQLTGYYQYFQGSTVELNLNAWRLFKGRHGPYIFVKNANTREPLYFLDEAYDYDYKLGGVETGYSYLINPSWQLGGGVLIFREDYRAHTDVSEVALPNDFRTDKWSAKLFSSYNTLTNYFHHIDGWRIYGGVEYTTNLDRIDLMSDQFTRVSLDIRYFEMTGKKDKLNLAARLSSGLANFNGSPFAAFVKDDLINIRGVGDRIARGSSEITLNLEARQDIFSKGQLFGQGVLFLDYNNILPSDYWARDLGRSFGYYSDYRVGLGLRLGTYYFFNSVLRLDAAFDPRTGNFEGLVLGVGQFF